MVQHALQELFGTPDNSHGEQQKGKVNHSKVERLGTELMKISGSAVHKEGAPSWRFRPPINTLGNPDPDKKRCCEASVALKHPIPQTEVASQQRLRKCREVRQRSKAQKYSNNKKRNDEYPAAIV
jgi:hypothetical protein